MFTVHDYCFVFLFMSMCALQVSFLLCYNNTSRKCGCMKLVIIDVFLLFSVINFLWYCLYILLVHTCHHSVYSVSPKSKPQNLVHVVAEYVPIVEVFCSGTFGWKLVLKWLVNIPPHLNCFATLPCKIWMWNLSILGGVWIINIGTVWQCWFLIYTNTGSESESWTYFNCKVEN